MGYVNSETSRHSLHRYNRILVAYARLRKFRVAKIGIVGTGSMVLGRSGRHHNNIHRIWNNGKTDHSNDGYKRLYPEASAWPHARASLF